MEPPSPLISGVNPSPSRFINRTVFFSNALAACFDVRQYHCHLSIFIGSLLYQRAKPPQRTVVFINLLEKMLTPKTVWEVEAPSDGLLPFVIRWLTRFCLSFFVLFSFWFLFLLD